MHGTAHITLFGLTNPYCNTKLTLADYIGMPLKIILHCVTGEVGGFMGLLLGGSVLTLCEIVDYIIHTLIVRIANRKKKKSENQNSNEEYANQT